MEMKLKEIKSILNDMTENEIVDFYSYENGSYRKDRVKKIGDNEFENYSSGQCWSDQEWSKFDYKEMVKILWNSRPHEAN